MIVKGYRVASFTLRCSLVSTETLPCVTVEKGSAKYGIQLKLQMLFSIRSDLLLHLLLQTPLGTADEKEWVGGRAQMFSHVTIA